MSHKSSSTQLSCNRHWENNYKKFSYMFTPIACFACAFAFQSFMLHITTHLYVYYMEHGPDSRRKGDGMLYDVIGEWVAARVIELSGRDLGGRASAGAVTEGRFEIPLMILDASGVIPAVFCVLSFVYGWMRKSFSIKVWTYTFVVASTMAVVKGIVDTVTIMPDSIGWEACKERLQDAGLQQMRDMNLGGHFQSGFLQALWNEIVGIRGTRVRYCSDMMVSGHTYFAVLFSIAAYKQTAYSVMYFPDKKWLLRVVAFACCLCLLVEVVLVAAARFHYTVDVLMAIILVVLLFDSTYVEKFVDWWSEGFPQHDLEQRRLSSNSLSRSLSTKSSLSEKDEEDSQRCGMLCLYPKDSLSSQGLLEEDDVEISRDSTTDQQPSAHNC